MQYVIEECRSCNATGVYSGFAEPPGVAVVCLGCGGSGAVKHSYVEFTRRRRRAGIKTVSKSRGMFVATGVGPKESSDVPYEDFFLKKISPPK